MGAPRCSFFESLRLDDWDEPLTTTRPVLYVRRFHLTARQRERRIQQLNYKIARDLADAKWEEQCAREDELTKQYLAKLQAELDAAAEKERAEIQAEARGLAHEIVSFERAFFRQRMGGRGFRPRR